MPAHVKNSTTGAGSELRQKAGVCASALTVTGFPGRPSQNLVTTMTELPRLFEVLDTVSEFW